MSNVKWIKLSTNMFEDEKIRLIEQMPDSDTILIIWVKLLSQAGKTNASGYIYLSENIPYTDEMLATIFNRPVSTVRLALKTFQDFGMISIDEHHFISIENWEKHQNIEGLEKIREQTRKRVARHRQRQKEQKEQKKLHVTQEDDIKPINDNGNDACNVTVTESNATEEELEEELELEVDKEQQQEKESVAEIIQFWDNNGFGINNMHAKESLLLWLDDSPFQSPKEMILKALDIASKNNARRLNYVEGILKNWTNESLLTIEEVEENDNRVRERRGGNARNTGAGASYEQALEEVERARKSFNR